MFFIDKYGTLGMFGEDGIESLLPWESRCRMLTGSIRNPIKRVTATNKHLAAKQLAKPKKQAEKKRSHEEYAANLSERKERGDAKRAKNAVAPGATPLLLGASAAAAAIEMDPQPQMSQELQGSSSGYLQSEGLGKGSALFWQLGKLGYRGLPISNA